MAKKQKRIKPKEVPTKRQLSRWQRERRMRRIIMSVAAVFLAGIIGYVCYGYYDSKVKPLHGIVIEVNDTSFNMDYYVKMLDTQTRDMEPTYVYYMTDQVARYIEDAELMKQGADDLGIVVTTQEIDEEIERNELPNDDKIYRDIIRASLLGEKLQRYFNSTLPDTMEQAHVRVMLVESQEVADEVIAEIESGGNFTALVEQFSCNPQIKGDLGWLPKELMPNSSIEEAAFSLEPNELSTIYDDSATKSVGYWLIEVTERDEEEGIKARAMLLSNKQEAQEVKAKLDIGGNFTALARDLSQHPSKNNGGELGWLKQGDMGSEAFDKVAFNLTLNEVSQPVKDESIQTKSGYWIIKLLEKGKHELSEEVRQKLANNNFVEWLQEQRENSTINNYLDEEKKGWAVEKVLKGR